VQQKSVIEVNVKLTYSFVADRSKSNFGGMERSAIKPIYVSECEVF
jgi:hypothetical protein